MALVSGVHHLSLGVADLPSMRAFYRDVLGFTGVLAEFEDVGPPPMREISRVSDLVFSGAIIEQPGNGALSAWVKLQLIQLKRPTSRALRADRRYGDIGVNKMTIAVADAAGFYSSWRDRINFCGVPQIARFAGREDYLFIHAWDPEGNLLEFVTTKDGIGAGGFGGIRSVAVGVADLDRSLAFYRDVCGLAPYGVPHEAFAGRVDDAVGGPGARVRSCVIAGRPGEGGLELIERTGPRGRSLPFGTIWGDCGYNQVAFSCTDIHAALAQLAAHKVPLLDGAKHAGPGSFEETGAFVYACDPDGVPIEFLFLPP